MRGGVPARGGRPNFGDSLTAVTLGMASGTARRSPQRGVDGACLAGRAGGGNSGGGGLLRVSPSSLCPEKRLRPAVRVRPARRESGSPDRRARD